MQDGFMVDLGHAFISPEPTFSHQQSGKDSSFCVGCWDEWNNPRIKKHRILSILSPEMINYYLDDDYEDTVSIVWHH